ncbi:MAG: CRISPR-associated helicase Cas3' [Armatimonadetes bacterium]|nr:CRISPR-associated helicase Cas3' [Armatimonadota bacterium]
MNEQTLIALWGKSVPHRPGLYHPLLFHMLDVAHTAWSLWERLPGSIRIRISKGLGDLSEEQARFAVSLLAGLHDLGKASPPFQHKVIPLWQGVESAGFSLPSDLHDKPHGMVSSKEIERLYAERVIDWQADPVAANILAVIAGGHHGVFPRAEDLIHIAGLTLGDRAWQIVRDELARSVQEALEPQENLRLSLNTRSLEDKGIAPLLAGLIAVADWLGSSKHFSIQGTQPLADYIPLSRGKAGRALDCEGWRSAPAPPAKMSFEAVFEYLDRTQAVRANAVQSATSDCLKQADSPFLLIIEAPMGGGKTEAALYAADHAMASGLAHGFYIALPTQATSNAMHSRVISYLEHRLPGIQNMPLVHANALLDEAYRQLVIDAPIYEQNAESDSSGEEGRVIAQRWFAEHKKQALLAPFGVGTIDQALLSVLQTRHWFVRLFGLAGKAVIFDEVHAYDIYMSAILSRLLQWLAELGCPVILLSATLPRTKRRDLVDAYRWGAWKEIEDQESKPGQKVPYPRLTYVDANRVEARSAAQLQSPASEQPRATLLEHTGPQPESILVALRQGMPEGGCAAVICNTVDRAQEVYLHLRDALRPEGWECLLFHARSPFRWRHERETDVLERFGKGGSRAGKRPSRCVLVATQVIEQSLDLDFDWMASDIAPVDLLLQRMGRLQRHPHIPHPVSPRFVILCEGTADGPPPTFDNAGIYDRYILLRSWLAVRNLTSLRLPDNIEPLVAQIYDEPEPAGLDAEWINNLARAARDYETNLKRDRKQAENVLVAPPDYPEEMLQSLALDLHDDDEPDIHPSLIAATRIGQPSIQLVCLGSSEEGCPLPSMPSGPPSAKETAGLRQYSLSLQSRRLFYSLCGQPVPTGWEGSPYLRYHRVLDFINGTAQVGVGGYRLRISHELGLVIEKLAP